MNTLESIAAAGAWHATGRPHICRGSAGARLIEVGLGVLQQTVATVIPYFEAFMRRFPEPTHWPPSATRCCTVDRLTTRACNLHRAAQVAAARWFRRIRSRGAAGIGRSTAGAILALATGRHAILDGNVKRVLAGAMR